MKDYIIEISFTGRAYILIKANSEEEAKDALYEHCIININVEKDGKEIVEIDTVDADFIEKEAGGNVKESYISDMEIYEDD